MDGMTLTLLCLGVALLLYVSRGPIARILTPPAIPGVPTVPDVTPILGDIPYMARAAIRDGENIKSIGDLAELLGPLYQMRVGPFWRNIIISDYDLAERLVLSGGRTFEKATWSCRMFSPFLNKAIVGLPAGEMFKHHVRIIGPAMTPKYLGLCMPRAVEIALELVELFKEKMIAGEGRAWDVAHDMEGATMDAIWAMAFGDSSNIINSFREQVRSMSGDIKENADGVLVFDCKRPELAESTMQVFESVSQNPLFNEQLHWFVRKTPTYRRHYNRLQQYLATRIADARKHAAAKGSEAAVETAGSTLEMMVARELRGEDWMPEEEMKQELLEYLVAGTETSGVLLTWWMKLMANHPEVQHKLHAHLLSTCPEITDRPLRYEDITPERTPYLEAVVWESLRISKTTGGFMRETTEETVIMGHHIPKGTGVIFSGMISFQDLSSESVGHKQAAGEAKPWTRRVGHWAAGTGKLFQPERWIDADGKFNPLAGPSVHFGMGHRACFGRNLATMEIRLFIAYLSTNFFFAPLPAHQNGNRARETIARHPVHSYARPVLWSSPEAQQ